MQDLTSNDEDSVDFDDSTGLNGDLECLLENRDDTSTMQPLAKKRRRKIEQTSKEDRVLDEAISVLNGRKSKNFDADDAFGQHVAASLQNLKDTTSKEYIKFKFQELIFQAQCGMLPIPSRQANISQSPIAFLPQSRHILHADGNRGESHSASQSRGYAYYINSPISG